MFKIALEELVKLYSLASLGKLLGGLVHNINGPLQNLGMDIEMMSLSFSGDSSAGSAVNDKIKTRLKRMDEEFENVTQLMRIISAKAISFDDQHTNMPFNDFLDLELTFLKGNLYFKHHVESKIEIEGISPLLNNLPANFGIAFGWFLQELVETTELHKIPGFNLKCDSSPDLIQITILTSGKNLPDDLSNLLGRYSDLTDSLESSGNNNLGIILSLIFFKQGNISVQFSNRDSESEIVLNVPVTK